MKSVIAQALKGDKATTKLLVNFLEKLPKYAFADDEVAYVVTKANRKAMEEFVAES